MWINVILMLIFFGCFAFMMTGGLWSNTLTLVNVITSALLATNYFEPVADFFEDKNASMTYVWDFFALWLVFGASMVILRAMTDSVSKVKVRFFVPVEKAGGILMALWTAWIVICFTTMTMHTAPLARSFLGGSFQPDADATMLFGLGPDRVWLGWVNRESRGALSRLSGVAPFDPRGEFILRYGDRRAEFEKQLTLSTSGSR
jgi:hypothetical protein